MYFRKLTFILACIAAFVGFLIGFVGGGDVSFDRSHETYTFWHNPYAIFYYPFIGALIAFFATFGVYYLIRVLYNLFRWAWKSTET